MFIWHLTYDKRPLRHLQKTHFLHYMEYSFWLAARVIWYAPFYRQDSTYHGLCYTSHGALAGTRNSSMGPPWGIDLATITPQVDHGLVLHGCGNHFPYAFCTFLMVSSACVHASTHNDTCVCSDCIIINIGLFTVHVSNMLKTHIAHRIWHLKAK